MMEIEDLHKLYPEVMPELPLSTMKEATLDQKLAYFLKALNSIRDSWKSHQKIAIFIYDSNGNMDNTDLKQLGLFLCCNSFKICSLEVDIVLATLDFIIKTATELIDIKEDNFSAASLSQLDFITSNSSKDGDSSKDSYSTTLAKPLKSRTEVTQDSGFSKRKNETTEELKAMESKSTMDEIIIERGRGDRIGKEKAPSVPSKGSMQSRTTQPSPPSPLLPSKGSVLSIPPPPALPSKGRIQLVSPPTLVPSKGPIQPISPLPPPIPSKGPMISIPPPPPPPTMPSKGPILSPSPPPHVLSPQPPSTPSKGPSQSVPPPPPSPVPPKGPMQSVVPLPPLMPSKGLMQSIPSSPSVPSEEPIQSVPIPPVPLKESIPPMPLKGSMQSASPPSFLPSKGQMQSVMPPPLPLKPSKGSVPTPMTPLEKGPGPLPPPPPSLGAARSLNRKGATTKLRRSAQMATLFRDLKGKMEVKSAANKSGHGRQKQLGGSPGGKQGMSATLAELTKRSSYFQQIEEDLKKHSKTIMELKAVINSFKAKDMAMLVKFQKKVDSFLEGLTDESQVLVKFEDFPTKKLEALRAASALYSKLDMVVMDLKNWETMPPLDKLLDKFDCYFTKVKVEVEALERIKDEEAKKFKSQNIDFDINVMLTLIKELMVDVSSSCIELALKERREAKAATMGNEKMGSKTDGQTKGSVKILWRAFQLAFRVYSFAGGQDERANKLARELAYEILAESPSP